MSDKAITFLLAFSISLIILLLLTILVKVYKIEKKYVREIRVYRLNHEIKTTIKEFEEVGYKVVNVVRHPTNDLLYMIIFVKVK